MFLYGLPSVIFCPWKETHAQNSTSSRWGGPATVPMATALRSAATLYGMSGAGAGVAAHMQPQAPPATPALSAYQPHQSHPRAQKQKPRGASTQTFSSKPLDLKLRLAISPHSSHLLCRVRLLNRRPGCPGRDHHGRNTRSPVPLLDARHPPLSRTPACFPGDGRGLLHNNTLANLLLF